jgi:DNA replication and repair protein RecF
VRISRFRIENFRNYRSLDLNFNFNANLILGQNGQGKTNLLEGVCLALAGQAIRYSKPEDLKNSDTNEDFYSIDITIESRNQIFEVAFQMQQGRVTRLLDRKKVSSARLKELFHVVLFSPESLNIIKGSASERRDLIDSLWSASEKSASTLQSQYLKCLKSKNRLLKDAASGEVPLTEAREILESLNTSFLTLATDVIFGRINAIREVSPFLKIVGKTIFNQPNVDISVDYVISKKSAIDWSKNQVYDALKLRLDELKEAELRYGSALVGPHKNEINFALNQKDARFFGSQGQQRAIILAFKIAQIELYKTKQGRLPLLLLDDVFSELDSERQDQLLKVLLEIPAQIFLTSTDVGVEKLLAHKEMMVFRVDKGNVNI